MHNKSEVVGLETILIAFAVFVGLYGIILLYGMVFCYYLLCYKLLPDN